MNFSRKTKQGLIFLFYCGFIAAFFHSAYNTLYQFEVNHSQHDLRILLAKADKIDNNDTDDTNRFLTNNSAACSVFEKPNPTCLINSDYTTFSISLNRFLINTSLITLFQSFLI